MIEKIASRGAEIFLIVSLVSVQGAMVFVGARSLLGGFA